MGQASEKLVNHSPLLRGCTLCPSPLHSRIWFCQAPKAVRSDGSKFCEACLPCRVAFYSRPAWACHASKMHGYGTKATVLTSRLAGNWCRSCGKVYSSIGRLRRHVAHSVSCQEGWGNFVAAAETDGVSTHPAAPPMQMPGVHQAVRGCPGSPVVHPGLLDALLQLQGPDEASVWDTVVNFIAPLEHLRATLQEWAQHGDACPEAADLAASVILLLDPELCCDSFRSKGLVARGLDFFPELVAPADLAFPFVLSGPVFRLALDRPPLPEFRHPFHCSVPLAQASRQAAWHEAACDTLGALVQQAQVAPVMLVADGSALACLEPATTWLYLGGFERCSEGVRSPRS